jgi:iron complex outermembrane recepter protein
MTTTTRDEAQSLNRTVLASTIGALLAGGSTAQAQAPAQQPALEEITVTGSRIVRRDLEAPSPIVTIDAERLENSSTVAIESVLNQLPQFVPEGTQFDQGIQAGPTASLGIGSLNLRGIGANRTLVLIDGRRAQPANAALIIDVNTIPSAAIQRVETITGGASAVYGADAMAGVVNFILKDDFEGVDLDFQTSQTAQGDGGETRFTSLLGVNGEDGNSNVMLGVEWYKRGVVNLRDRDFYMNGWFDQGSNAGGFIQMPGYSPSTNNQPLPTGGAPLQSAVDQIFTDPTRAAQYAGYFPCASYTTYADCQTAAAAVPGSWTVNRTSEIYFNRDLSPFVLSGAHGYNSGYDSATSHSTPGDSYAGVRRQPNGDLGQVSYDGEAQSPLERRSLFGRATHDINDRLTAFAQANYASVEVKTGQNGYPPAITVWSAPVPMDGRPIPPALATLLATRVRNVDDPNQGGAATINVGPNDPWQLFRVLDFLGGPATTTSQSNVYQIMAGIDGSFSNRDWTWEGYVSSGKTDVTNFFENMPSLQRYWNLIAAAPSAFTLQSSPGNGTWGIGSFTQGRNYGQTCTSGLPIFSNSSNLGPGKVSQDCLESIAANTRQLTTVEQNIAEFNLQGKIADMRAGELRFAAGISSRKNEFSFEPGETNDRESVAEQPMSIFASNDTAGQTKVQELYGELLVPVTSKFDLEFGARWSDYVDSDVGTTDTAKAMFTFRATEGLSLRGGYQKAERAANTAELFQGVSLLVVGFPGSDPCSYTTTHPWGNVAANANRLAVQTLCAEIINKSDGNPLNDNTSVFGLPGSAAANNFARPGNPFFPLEIELRKGNPAVQPEKGETYTLGLVLQGPGSLENLTASFDWYDIEIQDAIAPLNSLFAYQQCFNANGSSNPTLSYTANKYCPLILRNVTSGERSSVDAPFINTGSLKTSGLDISVNWTKDVGDGGSFFVNSLLTYLDEYIVQDAPGTVPFDAKGTLDQGGQYEWKMTNTFGYNFGGGKANVGVQWRYLPSIQDESAARNPGTRVFPVDAYQAINVFAGYAVNDKMDLRMGVDNLLDEDPLIVGAQPGDNNAEVTRPDYFDILGRRAYIGVKFTF